VSGLWDVRMELRSQQEHKDSLVEASSAFEPQVGTSLVNSWDAAKNHVAQGCHHLAEVVQVFDCCWMPCYLS
jgi:hypothetical protein